MSFGNIHFIINPAAGNDEPILSWINDAFKDSPISTEIHVTQGDGDAERFTKEALQKKADCIAVYGGDGTVMNVAETLFQSSTPMAIIPGGTANVLSKELGIPQDTKTALALLTSENLITKVDMGICNEKPFVIRINIGLMATMVTETDRSLKEKVGQLAYAVTAVSEMKSIDIATYEMILDGKQISSQGVSLVVANSGNVGIPNMSLLPMISMTDGFFDVIVLKTKDLGSLVKWAGAVAVGSMPEGIVDHWKVKTAKITVPQSQAIIIDDTSGEAIDSVLDIHVVFQALNIVVPLQKSV